jgi:hypothetical protein
MENCHNICTGENECYAEWLDDDWNLYSGECNEFWSWFYANDLQYRTQCDEVQNDCDVYDCTAYYPFLATCE